MIFEAYHTSLDGEFTLKLKQPMLQINMFKTLILIAVAHFLSLGTVFAQGLPNAKGEALFSSRPKDMWQLGIGGGSFLISGDVKPQFGWGTSIHLRKSLGYSSSLRGEYLFAQARGLNYQASSSGAFPDVAPFRGADAQYMTSDVFYQNYFMSQFHAVSLQTVYNLNNLGGFYNQRKKWALNLVLGFGAYAYQSSYDALDASGNSYDYSSATAGLNPENPSDRRTIRKNLKALMDNDYESPIEQNTKNGIILGRNSAKPFAVRSFLTLGLNLEFLITKRLSLALEHQTYISGDDFLDGKRKGEKGFLTPGIDIPHFTSLRLNFHLGNKDKRTEPLWFIDPLARPMEEIADAEDDLKGNSSQDDDLPRDDNKDGVTNVPNQEPNTPADAKERTLDSDGVPNRDDPEPYLPPSVETNEREVAKLSPLITEEKLQEFCDQLSKAKEDDRDSKIENWYLPMIHFDSDSYRLRPEAYSQLKHIAAVMKSYPSSKVVAYGHTDTRGSNEYNQMLSYNRVMNAIDFLSNTYDIEKDRFIIRYDGKSKNLIPNTNKAQEHFMNRRVEFYVAGDNEKGMARPESDGGKNRKWKY